MPIDRSAIDEQLKNVGEGERWWEHREFRDMPYILNSDETIRGLSRGRLLGSRRPRIMPVGAWLLVATDQRLICLRQERFGRKQIELRAGQIIGIRHKSRMRNYQITVHTAQRRYRLRIPKEEAFRFLDALAPLMPQPTPGRPLGETRPFPRLPGIAGITSAPGLSGLAERASLLLSAPDYVNHAELARVEANVETLEKEVERLQQQVEFLEKLLQERAEGMLTGS